MTWQLLAAQQAVAALSHLARQLLGLDQDVVVNINECMDKFKVLESQFKHLSVTEEDDSEVPTGLLFYKDSRIVALATIRPNLMSDAHGMGHVGVTKTCNGV